MLIRKIEITNFRQYKGCNTIEFSTEPNRNVTVIMGDNGAGKTTLAQAFTWCLYGTHTFKVKELINRDVRDELVPGEKTEVKVSLQVLENNQENLIVRKNNYLRTNTKLEIQSTSFSVATKNAESGEWVFLDETRSDLFVKNMLPKELSSFFFFDGERMDLMSKDLESGKSKDFAEAVHGIVGQTSLRNAITHFKPSVQTTVAGKIIKSMNEQGGEKTANYGVKIQGQIEIMERCQKELDEIEPRITSYMEMALNCKNEILSMSSQIELTRSYNKMNNDLANLEKEKKRTVDELLKYFSLYTEYFFSMPLAQDALLQLKSADKLDKGIPKLHADTIKFLLNRKKCICGNELCDGNEAMQELYKLLDVVPPKSLSQSISDFTQKMNSNAKTSVQYEATILMYIKTIRDKQQLIDKLERDIQDTYSLLTDTSKANTLNQQKKIAEENAEKLKKRQQELDGKKAIAEKERKYLEAERERLLVLDEKNQINRKHLAYAMYIYENMVQEYSENEKNVRDDLQREINAVFNQIYDGGISIEVDEKYNVKVSVNDVLSSNDELEKNTAQNYAIIFAFITGIIALAKKNQEKIDNLYAREIDRATEGYPLVMDAPLSAFDKTRIENICKTIPNIAQQIIMFIKDTDGDVAEQHMSNKIGKRYSIIANSQTETRVEER